MITSADLDHNDKLIAAGKKEKLEWVTPKISLMATTETDGPYYKEYHTSELNNDWGSRGPS